MTFFKVSDIYLIGPAKKIFRKFPKMDFLKNVLILPPTILLHRVDTSHSAYVATETELVTMTGSSCSTQAICYMGIALGSALGIKLFCLSR